MDEGDFGDEMEEAVADALESEDADEFFRRLRNIARRVAPVVGRIARTVAPIASAIPIPQAQLIGRAAGLIGRLMADEADEFDGLDEMANLAEEEEDGIDAAAPLVAGMAIRGAMRGAARLPRPVRRQLVRAATTATRQIARRHGPRAAVTALPGVLRQARRTAVGRGLPAQRLPQVVRQTAARVVRSPQLVRRMAQVAKPGSRRRCRGNWASGAWRLRCWGHATQPARTRWRLSHRGRTRLRRWQRRALPALRAAPDVRAAGAGPPDDFAGLSIVHGSRMSIVRQGETNMEVREFLRTRIVALTARARRLARIDHASTGIRPQDIPFAPSPAHFRAANARLRAIDLQIGRRVAHLHATWASAPTEQVLVDIAMVEREVDRARRTFGLFFEVFGQRGTNFAPSLAAHDAIAADCYAAVRATSPRIFPGPVLKPLTYMEHGYSPATMRRGVVLNRLLGEANPFPIIRIPWDRDNPWQAVFLHEVSHNLQADLGIWQENRTAVQVRVLRFSGVPLITRIYGLWHKEIFADLAAMLLGGPAAAWGMALFLAHPSPRVLTFRPGGAHPTGYLRILIMAEMLRRMGFGAKGDQMERVWRRLYDPRRYPRVPAILLRTASGIVPQIVDEIAFQTRRNLAQRALVDVIPFRASDEEAIREGARLLVEGRVPTALPPRHLVSAASYALSTGQTTPTALIRLVIGQLVDQPLAASARSPTARLSLAA